MVAHRGLACLVFTLVAFGAPVSEARAQPVYDQNRVLVKWATTVHPFFRDIYIGAAHEGAREIRYIPVIDWSYVQLQAPDTGVIAAVEDFKADPEYFADAQPNYYHEIGSLLVPNDPEFGTQWHLRNTGQGGCTVGADIDAVDAWDYVHESPNAVIAVIDEGFDLAHPDLTGNTWINDDPPGPPLCVDDDNNGYKGDFHGYDFANEDPVRVLGLSDPGLDPTEVESTHGTRVAGIIAGHGDNVIGIAGATWRAQLMNVKVARRRWPQMTSRGLAEGIVYAFRNGAKVANNSFTHGRGFEQIVYDAIEAACEAGMVFVAAGGNDGADNDANPLYPASYDLPCVIAVGMTDCNDELIGSANQCANGAESNYGATSVHLAAPGIVWTTSIDPSTCPTSYVYANSICGTSASAPQVAAAAALLLTQNPSWAYQQVKDRILATVDVLPSLEGKMVSEGRLNLSNALDNVAPVAVSDLDPFFVSSTAVFSEWTAPGDNGTSGTAQEYDFRYSATYFSDPSWYSATRDIIDPPQAAGNFEGHSVDNLQSCTWYYFGIKTKDNGLNLSLISNLPSAKTLCGGGGPPPKVSGPFASAAGAGPRHSGTAAGSVETDLSETGPSSSVVTTAEASREPDGTWEFLFRAVPASEVTDWSGETGITVQSRAASGNWVTRSTFAEALNETSLGMCWLRDEGRIVLPASYDVAAVSQEFRKGSAAYGLRSAEHSRHGVVTGPDVSMEAGDVLRLVYQAAGREPAEDTEPWYVVLNRMSPPVSMVYGSESPVSESPVETYAFALGAAHPNPASQSVRLNYTLGRAARVSLRVYNVAGALVRDLVSESQQAGRHSVSWDLRDNGGLSVRRGVYFYRMQADDWVSQKKVVLLDP